MKRTYFSLFFLSTLLFSQPSLAGKFANQFVEFELPSDWVCLLEGAEWVCQNQKDASKKKDAIIILAAKIQGDQDTLDQYLGYLKNPKSFITPQGKSVTSQVRYAQNKTIQDHPWVDSLHLQSEIPGFYTRYLATLKDGIGILVTYSVNRNKYQEYAPLFDSMVSSLKAFRREGGLNAAAANTDLFNRAKVPSGLSSETVFGVNGADDSQTPQAGTNWFDDPMLFYGGAALVALLLLTIVKRLKKK